VSGIPSRARRPVPENLNTAVGPRASAAAAYGFGGGGGGGPGGSGCRRLPRELTAVVVPRGIEAMYLRGVEGV